MPENKKNKQKRKPIIAIFLCVLCLLQLQPQKVMAAEYWPEGPEIEGKAAIVMEASTGTVLYEKNSTEAHYPASITKIMTTMLALENSQLDEVVTFSDEAIDNTFGSGIARDYGEEQTMEQCLYGIMLPSANECAYAVAEHVGGNVDNFVNMMNEKAKELGCVNTHFSNPHGLQDENHYTCCYDMALIARAAYQNETYRIITGTARYTIPPTNKHAEPTQLQNHNEMLAPFRSATNYVYAYCTGGKTGYTEEANSTLVTYAEKDGMTLICVVMDETSPAQWTDSTSLFEYCFDNFRLFNVAENETNYVANEEIKKDSSITNGAFVSLDQNGYIVLPKTAEFADAKSSLSVNKNSETIVGTLSYQYAGRDVGDVDIVTTGAQVESFDFNQGNQSVEVDNDVLRIQIQPVWILLGIGGIIVLCILIFLIKKFVDNYYIIKHNLRVRKEKIKQFLKEKKRQRKKRYKRRRR